MVHTAWFVPYPGMISLAVFIIDMDHLPAHQVLKYTPNGKLLMEVGTKLEPGAGENHFCKPTKVAVMR